MNPYLEEHSVVRVDVDGKAVKKSRGAPSIRQPSSASQTTNGRREI